jgi:hypothetical protein
VNELPSPEALSFTIELGGPLAAAGTKPDNFARWLGSIGVALSFISLAWQFVRWRMEESWIKVSITREFGMSTEGDSSSVTGLRVSVVNKSKNVIFVRSVSVRIPAGLVSHRFERKQQLRRGVVYQRIYGSEASDLAARPMERPLAGDLWQIDSRRDSYWSIPLRRLKAFHPDVHSLRALVELGDGRRRFSRSIALKRSTD